MNYENGKKYVTKNGSIVECTNIDKGVFKVLKGGHKFGGYYGCNYWGGYSSKKEPYYDVTPDGEFEVSEGYKLAKEQEDIVHGLDIVGPVLNFYEVACMMKKNKKAKFKRLNTPFLETYDIYSFQYPQEDVIDFVATSEWVKI